MAYRRRFTRARRSFSRARRAFSRYTGRRGYGFKKRRPMRKRIGYRM